MREMCHFSAVDMGHQLHPAENLRLPQEISVNDLQTTTQK